MKEYNVDSLTKNLKEHISKLNIDPKFLDNPAFYSFLEQINGYVLNMNFPDNTIVKQTEQSIFLECVLEQGKYTVSISKSNNDTLRCQVIKENNLFYKNAKEKELIETKATIDKAGKITITTAGSNLNNMKCENNECNKIIWAEQKSYTTNGIMHMREYKQSNESKFPYNIEQITPDMALGIPRQAFIANTNTNLFKSSTTLIRDSIDTAKITTVERDLENGIDNYYHATIPLDKRKLQELVIPNSYQKFQQDIIIPPLSKEQIEEMLKNISDPKIAQGLMEYAVGRDRYSYNSALDPNFCYKVDSKIQSGPKL